MAKRHDRTREEFVEWLCMTDRTRRAWGLPLSEREFADVKGLEPRTLRRWKGNDEFLQLWRQREQEIAQQAGAYVPREGVGEARPHTDRRAAARREPPEAPGDVDEEVRREALEAGFSAERAEYESIKSAVAEKAREGDPQAVEKWMKYWGGRFAEEERAERQAQFGDMDDVELVGEVLGLIGVDRVSEWLEQRAAVEAEA